MVPTLLCIFIISLVCMFPLVYSMVVPKQREEKVLAPKVPETVIYHKVPFYAKLDFEAAFTNNLAIGSIVYITAYKTVSNKYMALHLYEAKLVTGTVVEIINENVLEESSLEDYLTYKLLDT